MATTREAVRQQITRLLPVYAQAPRYRIYVELLLGLVEKQVAQWLDELADRYSLSPQLSTQTLDLVGKLLGINRAGIVRQAEAFGFANTGSYLRPVTAFNDAPFVAQNAGSFAGIDRQSRVCGVA